MKSVEPCNVLANALTNKAGRVKLQCNFMVKEMNNLTRATSLEYKGHPLKRKDSLIYFGSMSDKYIIMMQILETRQVKDMNVATKVSVQLQYTDPNIKSRDRVLKSSEKESLYSAMDVAAVWLDRALAQR